MKHLTWLALILMIVACDSNRIFEENYDLPNQSWSEKAVVNFDFEITDATREYNVYANISNTKDYPFYNLYYQYTLADSIGKTIDKELMNVILFEPKTGEPFGSGLGDVFDHQQPLMTGHRFPDAGKYSIKLEQYMRQDTLSSLISVGIRIEQTDK